MRWWPSTPTADPGLVVVRRGDGWIATCAAPVELLLAAAPERHGPDDPSWGLYAGLLEVAGIREPVGVDHPDVTTGTLSGLRRAVSWRVTNHGPATSPDASAAARRGDRRSDRSDRRGSQRLAGGAIDGEGHGPELELAAHGAALIGWRNPA